MTRTAAPANGVLQSALFALVAVLMLSLMDALVKRVGETVPVTQIMFMRTWAIFAAVLLVGLLSGRRARLATRRPGAHLLRGLFGLLAFLSFFYAVTRMPLAQAVAIMFSAPLFVAMLSALWLGEHVGPRRWSGMLLGFGGVLLIVRPFGDDFSTDALLALLGAAAYATTMVQTKRLSDTESAGSLVLWQALVACVGTGLIMPFVWYAPSLQELLQVAAIGLLSAAGHYGLIAAYSRAEASLIAPLDYSAMLWAVLFGYLFWGELPDWQTVAGCTVVISAGLYILLRERQLAAA